MAKCACGCGLETGRHGLKQKKYRSGHNNFTHRMTGTPEHKAYTQAKYRCQNPNEAGYENYGGRGIEFRFADFESFFRALGSRPKGKSLDRIDNNGHYEAGNVRWATMSQQLVNKRHKPNMWGHRGISKAGAKFQATITRNYNHQYLGVFSTVAEAAAAYDAAAKRLDSEASSG